MVDKPSKEELENAMNTCLDYVAYLQETEPYATNSIMVLENAADELSAGVEFYDENYDEDADNEKRDPAEGPLNRGENET